MLKKLILKAFSTGYVGVKTEELIIEVEDMTQWDDVRRAKFQDWLKEAQQCVTTDGQVSLFLVKRY